jgi:hypothetical protein
MRGLLNPVFSDDTPYFYWILYVARIKQVGFEIKMHQCFPLLTTETLNYT